MDPRDQWIPAVRELGEEQLLPASTAGQRVPVSAGGLAGVMGAMGDTGMTSRPTPPAPAGPCAIEDNLASGSCDPTIVCVSPRSSLCWAL